MNRLAAIPLIFGLEACAEPVKPLEVGTSPSAICSTELTLADQLNTSARLGNWMNEAIEDGQTPGIKVNIDRDTMDLPEALDKKIPGDVESFGLFTYPQDLESAGVNFVTATVSDGSTYFYTPNEAVSCDDLSFAYRVQEFPVDLTVTGKCELNEDLTLTCQGSFYNSCDIKSESPLGPYEDCTAAANYQNAQGESFTITLD